MATGTVPSNADVSTAERSSFDDLIEEHVHRTQSCVRLVDLAGAIMGLLAVVIGYLVLMALVDHWLIFGGLSTWGRTLGCLGLVAVVLGYAARTLWPYCRHRINPLYAARALEQAQPTLKNSLVNFLLLKRQHVGVSEAVYRGVQQQAAAGLAGVAAESAVDRKRLTHVGFALIGVLLLAALYLVCSPKSPLKSAARILAPWANIAPVTRVQIQNVLPGDGETSIGQPVTVSAQVKGLKGDEPVTLHYSTLDDQVEGQTTQMFRQADELAHNAQLPPEAAGPQRDLMYRIEAGDAVAGPFLLHVVPAPTIQIEKIEYNYPAYTGLSARSVERLGDIKAIEGTKVVIHAVASHPIQQASVELDGLRGETRPMPSRGDQARFELPLRLIPVGSRREPEFTSYRLRLTSQRGDRNREPITFQIDVTPDVAPQVEIVEPADREVKVPADKDVQIEVRGRDPDYGLTDLRLTGVHDAETLFDEPLLKQEPKPWSKTYRMPYRFVPAQFKLQPGDVVIVRATAVDNKVPEPNRAQTAEYRVVVTDPENLPQPGDAKQPDEKHPQDKHADGNGSKPAEKQPGGGDAPQRDNGQKDNGEKANGEKQDSQKGGPGAGEKSADDKKPADDKNAADGKAADNKSNGDKPSDDKKKDNKGADNKGDESKDGVKNEAGEGNGGGQSKKPGESGKRSADDKHGGGADGQQQDKQSDSGQSESGSEGKGGQQGGKSQPGKPQNGKSQNGKPQGDGQGDNSAQEPADNYGDVLSEVLKQMKKDGKSPPEAPNKQPEQSPVDKTQAAQKPSDAQNNPGQEHGGQTANGEKSSDPTHDAKGANAEKQQGNRPDASSQGQPKQSGKPGDQQQNDKQQGGNKPDDKKGTDKQGTDKQGTNKQATDKQGTGNKPGTDDKAAEKPTTDNKPGDKKPGEQPGDKSADKPSSDPTQTNKSPSDKSPPQPAQGQQKSGPESGNAQGHQQQNGEQQQPMGGQSADKQPSGSQEGERPVGSQQSKPQEKPSTPNGTPGEKQPASADKTTDNDSQNPQKQRPSSTQSAQNGDKSGKGPQGSGQQQSGAGEGSAGNNQSADEGGNRSQQEGSGEQSGKAGTQQKSDHATGQAGKQPGDASSGKSDNQQQPEQPGAKKPADASNPGSPSGGSNAQPPGPGQQGKNGTPSGALAPGMGQLGDPQGFQPPAQSKAPGDDRGPGADEANVEYAKRATDLALTYLQDQLDKGQIDPELKKRTGWTDDEFRALVRSLEAQRSRGQRAGADKSDRRAYEEWLKSLGLHPSSGGVKTVRTQQERLPGARDDSQSNVPSALREQHDAFRKGILEQSQSPE